MSTPLLASYPPLSPRSGLKDCTPYRPRDHELTIDLRLDNNEAPMAYSNTAAQYFETIQPEMIRSYPNPRPLEEMIAVSWGIEARQVVLTAGADDALERALLATLDAGRTLLSVMPTFEMIPQYAKVAGASIHEITWSELEFPVEAIVNALDSDVGAVSVVTPNNPTGQVAAVEDLICLAKETRSVGAVLIVDLAYVEFSDDDPTQELLAFDNVVIIRTFSKAWGMAGLRVGYAIAPEPIASWLRGAGSPYPVSGPSLQIVQSRFAAGGCSLAPLVREVQRERPILERLLSSLGFSVTPSASNFVFARGKKAMNLAARLKEYGIAIRTFEQKELDSCVRITCPGQSDDFDRLCLGIMSAFPPAATLFDLDGVLADVSHSYDCAIVETCQCFGLDISECDIRRIKREGDANNDWVITHRLLAQNAIEVKLEEVIHEFERLYQGDANTPGLCATESLLIEVEQLRDLVRKLPCAVVTGRPRLDALRFLDRFNITELFDVVVCMEDTAEPKPSPQPLQLAVERLQQTERLPSSISNIWMIGDTVDDMNAAVAAGLIPVGVHAPDADPRDASTLKKSGACAVRPTVIELIKTLIGLTTEVPNGTNQ